MTAVPVEPAGWLSVPDVADLLGLRQREVRAMLRDKKLLGVPHGPNRALSVPTDFLVPADEPEGPAPLPNLRGTLILLADSGYDDAQAFRWLFTVEEELGSTPIAALRERRTHAVRRVAQTLAF